MALSWLCVGAAAKPRSDPLCLQTSQCMWLMQALGFLLSALPVEDILRNLHSLITPYIQQLEKLADETVRIRSAWSQADTHTHSWILAIGAGLVSVWSLSNGTFLCRTRLDLTLHHGLVIHRALAKRHTHCLTHSHICPHQSKKRRPMYSENEEVPS